VTSKDSFKEGNSNNGPIDGVIDNDIAREMPAFMRQLKSHTVPIEGTDIDREYKEVNHQKEQEQLTEESEELESIEMDL